MGLRPFLASLFPGKLAALFTLDPLVLPNIFFNKVCDPEERIGIQYGRDLQRVLQSLKFARIAVH